MTTIKRIAKNTAVLLVSQVISYVLAFFYMIYIARYLGPDGFGILSFALAFTGIFSIFADMGLNTLTVREIARDKSLTAKYFINVLSMKIILSILTLVIIALIINMLNYPQETVYTVYLVALSVILTALSGIFYSIFQAHEEMEYQSIGLVINSILMFAGVLLVIYNGLGVLGFAFIYVISSAISLLFIFIVYIWKFSLKKIEISRNFWRPTLKEALPFGLTGISGMIYTYIDSVMLSLIQGNEVVGWYNASYRLVLVLLFIPTVINFAIFPRMSQYHISSKASLMLMNEKYFKLMILVALPLGTGVTLLANKIILLIFGNNYLNSVIVLQIIIWTTVFTFVGASFVKLLESINKQIIITKISLICVIANIILNLLLIPKLSYIGASISTVITEIILVGSVFVVTYKIGYGINYRKNFEIILKVVIASIIMSIFIWYFQFLNLLILVVLAALLYFIVIYFIKAIEKDDIYLVKQIIGKK